MQRTFTTAFLAVLLALAAPAQAPQNDTTPAGEAAAPAPTPFEVAKDLAAKGRLDKALAQLDLLAAKTPEEAGVERLRGIILYQQEQLPEAIAAFTKAADQDPNDRESIEMRGVSLFLSLIHI